MRLDRIELNLRRRSSWEAIDLGLVMVRHWYGPVYRVWLTLVLPVAIAILAALWKWPMAGMLVVWWLKPVADRLLLKVFSESTFGEPPTPREVLRSLPTLLRRSGLFTRLTLRRFSPYRSFELPMLQLEGQRGKALRSRNRTLSRKVAGHAFWLMFVCAHLVIILETGLVQLVGILTPGDALGDFSLYAMVFGEADLLELHLFNAAWLVAESIVEPFYVAAGFSLYLNRRSELEGWDIEVAFRHMADSRGTAAPARPRRRGAGLVALVLLIAASSILPLPEASAAEPPVPLETAAALRRAPEGDVRQMAKEVLSDPVFGREVEELSWRPRARNADEKRELPWWFKHLQRVAGWVAGGVRGVFYVFMAVALAALLVVLYRQWGRLSWTPKRPVRAPETLFGLDLRPATLPADIPAAALAEADAGRFAAALSLLYRGALVALIERHHVAFRDGDTENACLQRVTGCVGKAAVGYFSALLEAWKASAYAASPPAADEMRALCRGWAEHFAVREGAR